MIFHSTTSIPSRIEVSPPCNTVVSLPLILTRFFFFRNYFRTNFHVFFRYRHCLRLCRPEWCAQGRQGALILALAFKAIALIVRAAGFSTSHGSNAMT
jgi:hypothetical protein